jgi:allantoicase
MQNSEEHTGPGATGDDDTPAFTRLADLASARVGGRAVEASDDFFAPRSNLLKPWPAVFVAGKFTSRGKWMDGWESRRRRTPGHDWCRIELGMRGLVRGVDVDTSYFIGNHPSHCAIEALDQSRPHARAAKGRSGATWTTILDKSPLKGNSHNYFAVDLERTGLGLAWTHLRLNIYPDGGVARFRAYGDVVVDWARVAAARRPVDLASIRNGGLVIGASDMHFGAVGNLIMPGRAMNMGDGWETRRRRGPGHDWAIVRLGAPGLLTRIEIDTHHFKGNYPDSASVDGCAAADDDAAATDAAGWFPILPQTSLRAHHQHLFSRELRRSGPVSHVRLNIFPDGGVSRLRVHGTLAPP